MRNVAQHIGLPKHLEANFKIFVGFRLASCTPILVPRNNFADFISYQNVYVINKWYPMYLEVWVIVMLPEELLSLCTCVGSKLFYPDFHGSYFRFRIKMDNEIVLLSILFVICFSLQVVIVATISKQCCIWKNIKAMMRGIGKKWFHLQLSFPKPHCTVLCAHQNASMVVAFLNHFGDTSVINAERVDVVEERFLLPIILRMHSSSNIYK